MLYYKKSSHAYHSVTAQPNYFLILAVNMDAILKKIKSVSHFIILLNENNFRTIFKI